MLYVWKSPRPANAEEAEALVAAWRAASPTGIGIEAGEAAGFEASDDVRWFSRELTGDAPPLWNPDAPAKQDIHPRHVMAVPLDAGTVRETLEEVYSLALKYDLVVYDPQRGVVDAPMAAMEAASTSTFWPRGAIRTAVVGLVGLALAIGAYVAGIPILSGVGIVIGGLLAVLAVATFALYARAAAGGGRGKSA